MFEIQFRLGTRFLKGCILVIPSCEVLNVIKSLNRTVLVIMCKIKGFREKLVCVIVSHFHICRSVVTRGCVFSAVLSNFCQKTTMADFR